LEAWELTFRDDPCCEGGAVAPARVSDALLSLRGAQRSASDEAAAAERTAQALLLRCDAAQAEAASLRAALHATCLPVGRTGASDGALLLLDPAAQRELSRLQAALDAATDALARKEEEVQALGFSKESKQGRLLMARVRTLIRENEEFGRELGEGRVHGLETRLTLLSSAVERLKAENAQLRLQVQLLSGENEELQLRAYGGGGEGGGGEAEEAAADEEERGVKRPRDE